MSIHKKRVLSGIQPSGKLHLGNYFGMMSRMIEYQEFNDLFCFIVNYHALTSIHDKNELKDNTINAENRQQFFLFGGPVWLVEPVYVPSGAISKARPSPNHSHPCAGSWSGRV